MKRLNPLILKQLGKTLNQECKHLVCAFAFSSERAFFIGECYEKTLV